MSGGSLPNSGDLSAKELYESVARDIISGKSNWDVVVKLVKQGWSEQAANQIVDRVQHSIDSSTETSKIIKKQRLEKHIEPPEVERKELFDKSAQERNSKAKEYADRMGRGAIGVIVGVIITVVTHALDFVPVTVTAYGFIILGIIWFFQGLFGWLKYKT